MKIYPIVSAQALSFDPGLSVITVKIEVILPAKSNKTYKEVEIKL